MSTVSDIIDAFGGPTEFGRACGFQRNPAARGSDMRQRGSIPSAYWQRIVEAARLRNIADKVNLEALASAHAERAA